MSTEANKKSNGFLLQGSILAAASIIVRVIGLVYRVPLTRIIGEDAIGYYQTAFEFYSTALLLSSYSLPLAVSKLVSARQITGRYKDTWRVLFVSLIFAFVVGAAASLGVYFGADLYGRFNHTPLVAIPLRVLAPTIFVFSIMGVIRGFFQGHGDMVPTAISQIVEQIVNAAVSIAAAIYMVKRYAGTPERDAYGAAGGTWGTFIGACAGALILIGIFFYRSGKHAEMVRSDESKEKERYSQILKILLLTVIPVVISQTVYQISAIVDVSIFHRTLQAKAFDTVTRNTWWGIYSGKYKLLTNVPVAVAAAMGTTIVPTLVAEIAKGRKDRVNGKIALTVKFNMIVAFPCAFGFMALGGPILQMLFGDTRILNTEMMQLGGSAVIFFALSTVTNGVLQGIHHMFIPVWHSFVALIIHSVTLWLLLRFTELNALALVICNILFALIVCIMNARSLRKLIGYKQEWRTSFVIPLISAAVMGAFADICYRVMYYLIQCGIPNRPGINNMVSCLVTIGLCVFVFFATLLLLGGLTEKEIEDMPKGRMLVKILRKLRLLRTQE